MASEKRLVRLRIKIREEIARILEREFDFDPSVVVTVTRAEISEDLFASRIYVSVYPEDKAQTALDEINSRIYEVQQMFNKRMAMRPVPRLRFVLDESVRVADTIERKLYELKNKAQ